MKNYISDFFNDYFEQDGRLLFLLYCLIYLLTSYIIETFVLTDEVYYNTYGEQLAYERIESFIQFRSEWQWVSYVFIPIILTIKMGLIAICINIGTLLLNYKVKFSQIFSLLVKAEVIFVAASIIGTYSLIFLVEVNDFTDLRSFKLFSLISFFDIENTDAWLVYLLRAINLFEVGYILILATGFWWLLKKSYSQSLNFILSTYGLGLITWIVFITFLQLNLS